MRSYYVPSTFAALAIFCVTAAHAQSQTGTQGDGSDAGNRQPTRFSSGMTAGAMSFTGGLSEQTLTVLLQFRPVPWLALSAAPGFGRAALGALSSNGPTDIPITSVAHYCARSLPWSPVFFGSLGAVLSAGSSGSMLGLGRSAATVGGGLGASPLPNTYASAEVFRPVTTATGNGSADFSVTRSFGAVTNSLGYSTEIGSADSAATLSRSIGGGVAFLIRGPLGIAIDGSHGLTAASPKWTVSVSFGTAFSGISPISGGSVFGRLKNSFGSRATSSSGYRTSGKGTNCRKMGIC